MLKENGKKSVGIGTGFVIGISIIYILFGLAMLFVPKFKEVYIIYIAGAILTIYGIILIVKYFMTGSYRDIGKYGFSIGVLSILIGVCMFVRSDQISVYLSLFLGACILLTSVIKLQNAVDLKSIGNPAWFVFLIIAIVFLAASVAIVLDPMGKVSAHAEYIYYVLTADGAVNMISTAFLAIAIRTSRKKAFHETKKTQDSGAIKKTETSGETKKAQTSEEIKRTETFSEPEKDNDPAKKSVKKSRKKEKALQDEPELYPDEPDLITADSDETVEDILRIFEDKE